MLDLAEGRHPFAAVLKQAKRPMVIVGNGALTRADGGAITALAARIARDIAAGKDGAAGAFNVLHTAASRVAGLDLGLVAATDPLKGGMEVVYLLGADEFDMKALGQAFVIYQGSHGDAGAHRADVILPAATYTEKAATYVNTEGRAQSTLRAAFAPGDAKEDWTILRALSADVGQTLPYDNLAQLRAAMYKAAPHLARLGALPPGSDGWTALANGGGNVQAAPFAPCIKDFYLTNPIARASQVMAELSLLASGGTSAKQAAE